MLLINYMILQYRLRTNITKIVNTTYGKVKGIVRKTVYDEEEYVAFEGIPYGKPPLDELQFRAPQPAEPWEDVLDCTQAKSSQLQKDIFLRTVVGTLDCLYVNVYAKTLISDKPLPVIVWIHGGGYQFGEASRRVYAPDYFMNKDVIFVAISYRLGAFGFLSLKDPDLDVPGNAGLKDQVLALRWVKENIANFNGDPNNITLMGESAGAASTHALMLTERTKGLFHKAILQSGSALCMWACTSNYDTGYRLACALGYKGKNNDKDVFRYLSKLKPQRIPECSNNLLTEKEEMLEHKLFSFLPVVEPYCTTDCIIPKPSKEMLKDAWTNDIPIITGITSFEGLFSYYHTKKYPDTINKLNDFVHVLPIEVRQKHNEEELKQMGSRLKQTYFGDKTPHIDNSFMEFLDLLSYKNFFHGVLRTVVARLTYAPHVPTYFYRFDFDSEHFNHFRNLTCDKGVRGVCHGDDISYLFFHAGSSKLSKDSEEFKTIQRMIGMWTTFATNSNPNCDEIKPSIWQPVTSDNKTPKCLNINKELDFIDFPEQPKIDVWNSFYTKESLV
ncbi:esterase B1-like [Teleopsis dalmanni]|uniref:esterase B1-like n=1 Tax=Teleopsis dalmanni TaxID=139649 RepID=UPI0018CCB4AE|nr:esterase B1-like [Teleopsis dalmanni]